MRVLNNAKRPLGDWRQLPHYEQKFGLSFLPVKAAVGQRYLLIPLPGPMYHSEVSRPAAAAAAAANNGWAACHDYYYLGTD